MRMRHMHSGRTASRPIPKLVWERGPDNAPIGGVAHTTSEVYYISWNTVQHDKRHFLLQTILSANIDILTSV